MRLIGHISSVAFAAAGCCSVLTSTPRTRIRAFLRQGLRRWDENLPLGRSRKEHVASSLTSQFHCWRGGSTRDWGQERSDFLRLGCGLRYRASVARAKGEEEVERMTKSAEMRLAELRKLMGENGMDVFIVSNDDPHGSEYVCDHHQREKFLTGFRGAGTALVTDGGAAMWTDSRYHEQAGEELDQKWWELMKSGLSGTPKMSEWIKKTAEKSQKSLFMIGFDPMVTSSRELDGWKRSLDSSLFSFIPMNGKNLVDRVWADAQPPLPSGQIFVHDVKYSGLSTKEKMAQIRRDIGAWTLVVSDLSQVAWLLNLRGSDIPETPLFLSYVLLSQNTCTLYTNLSVMTEDARRQMKECEVSLEPYENSLEDVRRIASSMEGEEKLWLDEPSTVALAEAAGKVGVSKLSPIWMAKAKKNEIERLGMSACHVRDGVAVAKFLHWIETIKQSGHLHDHTETSFANKLFSFRQGLDLFHGPSFTTISAVGPNTSKAHYTPSDSNSSQIAPQMYMFDSGGQYLDGTTDVTRTIHLGTPTSHEKEMWTRVLMGNIELSELVFPEGTTGPHVDSLARMWLWRVGLDYAHGTGHGVGSFSCCHEGPMGISGHVMSRHAVHPLVEGVVTSNEPAYYEEGAFGVRHENLMTVIKANTPHSFNGIQFNRFQVLTLAPFQTSMVDLSIFREEDISWINGYHARVREEVSRALREEGGNDAVIEWLHKATEPLVR